MSGRGGSSSSWRERDPERYLVLERARVTGGDCGAGGRSGRAAPLAGAATMTSVASGRVIDMTAPITDAAATGSGRRRWCLGGADRADGGRRYPAAGGGRRAARHESRLVADRSSRFRTLECGAGFRGGAAVQLWRLREVHRVPYVVVRCASGRHAGAYRAAVDRRRRGA